MFDGGGSVVASIKPGGCTITHPEARYDIQHKSIRASILPENKKIEGYTQRKYPLT